MTIRVAVSGASGRMGQAIIRLAAADDLLTLSAALEHKDSEALGDDAGSLAGIGALGVPITTETSGDDFDVLVEFTTPDATMSHLELCRTQGSAMMIGTTGLTSAQRELIQAAGADIPVVLAANTSVGGSENFGRWGASPIPPFVHLLMYDGIPCKDS